MKQFNLDEMLDNKLLAELKKEIPIDMLSEACLGIG